MDCYDSPNPRDPAIKLFGRKIPLPGYHIPTKPMSAEIADAAKNPDFQLGLSNEKDEDKVSSEQNGVIVNCCKFKDEQNEVNGTDQAKAFKKPDKILPCPRCNSLDTKFCYFNNYNVNQPRHFCKNCQRYWTAGGTMRNVPVGAGRRKNKQFASQYRQILVSSDGNPISKIHTAGSVNNQSASSDGNGMILNFGSEPPLCESMDTVLHLGDRNSVAADVNPVNIGEQDAELFASGSSALVTSISCSNDVTIKAMTTEQAALPSSCNEVTPQGSLPFYPGPPWSFPLNPGWSSVAAVTANGGDTSHVQFCPAPILAIPGGGFPPNIPLQFVPSSYLACRPALQDPSFASNGNCLSSPLPSSNKGCSLENGGSPTLGKHSRDSTSVEQMHAGNYILVPKTLRLDETDAASKCQVWATFGVISDQVTCSPRVAGFKGLEPKVESAHILEANSPALSRSHVFENAREQRTMS